MVGLGNINIVENKPANRLPVKYKQIEYGTAGFRDKGDTLHHVVFRMGILAALRAQYLNRAVGMMITASHNPVEDNGVKIVDPDGEMLTADWEILATEMANSPTPSEVTSKFAQAMKINFSHPSGCPLVFVGRDTRPTSIDLRDAAVEGIAEAMQFSFADCGIVTTPQLHYIVRKFNEDVSVKLSTTDYSALPTMYLNHYYEEICGAFNSFSSLVTATKGKRKSNKIFVDCANGVGVFAISTTAAKVVDALEIVAVNTDYECCDKLNSFCGADFVKVQQKSPCGVDFTCGDRYASFDGDADRIVFFYRDASPDVAFRLLDGDKIAILIAGYIGNLLAVANLKSVLSTGLIQTAYANGSSTNFICQKLKVPVVCVPTGVKHLHRAAQKFDIGVYFEANGHGTVIFSERACSMLAECSQSADGETEAGIACKKLDYFRRIINPAVGDALADLLAVEAILIDLDWSLKDWNQCYIDLPSRQLKVKVHDRSVISTEDAERRCVAPAGLQTAIDDLVKKVRAGRAFVRPSGTEDIVRIYAEAATQASADWLAYDVAVVTYQLAGGVAPAPSQPDCERSFT